MTDIDFPNWLQEQIDEKKWRPTDLAKHAHLSDTAVSRILRRQRSPDAETLLAIAKALKLSPITVFRVAGLLPPGPDDEVKFEDWKFLLDQMSPEDQEELRQIAEMKIERRRKDESLKSLNPRRSGG